MAKVDDLRQRRPKQVILTIVARLAHPSPHSESRSRRNHEPPKSGIPKRKKTVGHTRLSCKIDYLLRSNLSGQSMTSKYFTGDWFACSGFDERWPERERHPSHLNQTADRYPEP